MKCPRCGGSMLREAEGRGYVMKCVLCGQEKAMETMTRPATNGVAPVPSTADWTQIARERLAALVQEVAAVDVKKIEAERIHKALTVAEVERIPELPWKARPTAAAKKPESTGSARGVYVVHCARCGKEIEPGNRTRENGQIVCRAGCPAVATEAA